MEKKFLDLCIKNRKYLGLSIEDVAEILNIPTITYRKFEEGKIELENKVMRKIVQLYYIDINQFKDYSCEYDLSDVPDNIKNITESLINVIEGDSDA